MAFIYVTGAPGSGKTTLQAELKKRGYEAHDIDEATLGGPHNKRSGALVVMPRVDLRTPAWFEEHEWQINVPAIEALKARAAEKDIFLCGVAESDDEILSLFDKILYLELSDAVLKERLTARNKNDYGQNKFELEEILTRKKRLDLKRTASNITKIDAAQSVREVVDAVLSHA